MMMKIEVKFKLQLVNYMSRIKDKFHEPEDDIGEMTDMRNRNLSRWQNQQQRSSQETIRTTIYDNDSIINGVTSH